MKEDLRAILTNPECFPVELTLTSGDKVRIEHPDFVHFSGKLGKVFFYPPEIGGVFELIVPDQIAKVQARVKRSWDWFHFRKGSIR